MHVLRLFVLLGLLGSSYATSINQAPFGSQDNLQYKQSESQPGCSDVFHVTLYVSRNSSEGDQQIPVYHLNERVYASEAKVPTQWTFERNSNSGRYLVYAVHPSGIKHYWGSNYDGAIQITPLDYQAKEVSIAQLRKTDSPFDRPVLFWDDKCLVVKQDPADPLAMLPSSACDIVIAKFEEPVQWKGPDDLCPKEDLKTFDGCGIYEDCGGCFLSWRCCGAPGDQNPNYPYCTCVFPLHSEWVGNYCK